MPEAAAVVILVVGAFTPVAIEDIPDVTLVIYTVLVKKAMQDIVGVSTVDSEHHQTGGVSPFITTQAQELIIVMILPASIILVPALLHTRPRY